MLAVKPGGGRLGQNAPTMRTSLAASLLLLSLPFAAAAQAPAKPAGHPPAAKAAPGTPSPHAKEVPSPWAELADYTITVKVPPKGDTGTWKIRTYADPADVMVELDTPAPQGRTKGTIVLVGGQGIAVKGFAPEPGFEVDPLDAAIVNLKVLTQLLDAAAPGGPDKVKGKASVSRGEVKLPILASTPTATARFLAPWKLKGTLDRVDAKTVSFSLELDVPVADKSAERAVWTFTGTAGGSTAGRTLEDATSLAGFTAYNLAPKNAQQTHSTLKFGATKLPGPLATVKDLRQALATIPPPPPPKAPMPATKPAG